jgi:hypothetical protein
MTLTVEAKDKPLDSLSEVAICCDAEGLELLISRLEKLRNGKDHIHLMTPSWSGSELTEVRQGGDDYVLVNHLRVVRI